jgi:hypothetical protein
MALEVYCNGHQNATVADKPKEDVNAIRIRSVYSGLIDDLYPHDWTNYGVRKGEVGNGTI